MTRLILGSSIVLFTTVGCVTLPSAPSVMVLPGNGLSFSQFRYDDVVCQEYAYSQIGDISIDAGMADGHIVGAIMSSALGAVVGAAIGGKVGAAIGAGTGFAASSIAAGARASDRSSEEAQQLYDYAYIQCMYAKGHQVPISGSFSSVPARPSRSPTAVIPPPPSGYPPPPPSK